MNIPQKLFEQLNGLDIDAAEKGVLFETFRSAYLFKLAFPDWHVCYVNVTLITLDEEWMPADKCSVAWAEGTAVSEVDLPGVVDIDPQTGRAAFTHFASAYQFKMAHPQWQAVWLRINYHEVGKDGLWPE